MPRGNRLRVIGPFGRLCMEKTAMTLEKRFVPMQDGGFNAPIAKVAP